jgi:hypothetical protein
MPSDRRIAVVAGILFVIATAASLISTSLLNSILDPASYLSEIATSEHRVETGSLFLLIGAFASAAIAISLYPVLRRYREGLALGAVGFRAIEGVLYTVSAVSVLSLLTLSHKFVSEGAPPLSALSVSGQLLLSVRDWATVAAVLAFYIGAGMYYYVFHVSRLIPRWISDWGLLGIALGAVAAVLVIFGATDYMSGVQIALNVPIGVNELVLAAWLLARGFSSSSTVSEP